MRADRRLALVLLLYITADFVDPAIPGVFFFESPTLFVDGAVQGEPDASMMPATPPSPETNPADRVIVRPIRSAELKRPRPTPRGPNLEPKQRCPAVTTRSTSVEDH